MIFLISNFFSLSLYEAYYFIRMAEQALWLKQNIDDCIILLKNARKYEKTRKIQQTSRKTFKTRCFSGCCF